MKVDSQLDCSLSIPDSFCCGWCQTPMKNRYRPYAGTLNGEVKGMIYHCNSCNHTTDISPPITHHSERGTLRPDQETTTR